MASTTTHTSSSNGHGRYDDLDIAELVSKAVDPKPSMESEQPTWQLRTLADAYQPRPPTEYVINGLFRLPSVNVIFGAPGTLKSLLMADAAACIVAGCAWLKTLGEDVIGVTRGTKQVPVLWIDLDNGGLLTDERFDAVGHTYNLPPDAPFYYVSMPIPWPNLNTDAGEQLIDACIKQTGARCCFIDTLRDVSGDVDENSAFMRDVMSRLRRISEANYAAVNAIHHTNKDGGLRGSTTIEGAIDLSLQVVRKPNDIIEVYPKKVRSAPVYPFAAAFSYTQKPNTQGELETFQFYGARLQDDEDEAAKIRKGVRLHLHSYGPQNQVEIKQAVSDLCKVSKSKVRAELLAMVADGEVLEEKTGERNTNAYRLPISDGMGD